MIKKQVLGDQILPKSDVVAYALKQIGGRFHKSWALGAKRKKHPNLGENAISWA
jgi:hypothetical protein